MPPWKIKSVKWKIKVKTFSSEKSNASNRRDERKIKVKTLYQWIHQRNVDGIKREEKEVLKVTIGFRSIVDRWILIKKEVALKDPVWLTFRLLWQRLIDGKTYYYSTPNIPVNHKP